MTKQSPKMVKRVVTHPNLFMRVDGVLQKIPTGTEITVTEEHAGRHKLKLADPKEAKRLDASGKMAEGAELAMPDDVQAALASMQKQVDDANAKTKKAEAELAKAKKK